MNTQSTMHNRDDNTSIRELLLRRHAVLRTRFQTLRRRAGPSEVDSDGSILSGGEEVQAAAQEVRRQIVETDLALARLDTGSYGICEGCGQPIPRRRLEVLPTAIRCVACADPSARRTRSAPRLRGSAGRP
jgi:RNA polymerase-binding transcription factor DksA